MRQDLGQYIYSDRYQAGRFGYAYFYFYFQGSSD